jgi:hypothetical protein
MADKVSLSDLERANLLAVSSMNPLPTDSLADLRMKYWSQLQAPGASIADYEHLEHMDSVAIKRGTSMEDLRRAARYQQLGTPTADTEETNADLQYRVLDV